MNEHFKTNTVYFYDQAPSGLLPVPFRAGVCWLNGNLLYVVNAFDGVITSLDLVTREWKTDVATLPNRIENGVTTTIGDITYIYGGYDNQKKDGEDGIPFIMTFNNKTGRVGQLPVDFPTAAYGYVFSYEGILYAMSGTNNSSPVPNLFSKYDPASGVWTKLSVPSKPIQMPNFSIYNDTMYVFGAGTPFTGAFPKNYYLTYDFNKDVWSALDYCDYSSRSGQSILFGTKMFTYNYRGSGRPELAYGGYAIVSDLISGDQTLVPIEGKNDLSGNNVDSFASGYVPGIIYNGFHLIVGNLFGLGKPPSSEVGADPEPPKGTNEGCKVLVMKPAIPK